MKTFHRLNRCAVLGASLLMAQAALAANLPAEVRLRSSGAGQYLTDARGMTLYTYAADSEPGKSACIAECAKAWPPLRAAPSAVAAGAWTLVPRDDGAAQWAWRGQPLYTFAKDSYAGAMLGDGVGSAWRVALDKIAVPPGFAIRSSYLGRILTTTRGQTLYWPRGTGSDDALKAGSAWRAVYAPWMAQPRGDWTVSTLKDGQLQWTFRGHKLYSNAEDLKAGDTSGLQQGDDWEVAVLDAAPPLPSWVTVQASDMGEVYSDSRGHTLYVLVDQLDKIRALTCDDNCIRRNFQTIAFAGAARASGDWTAVPSPLGEANKVWAYRGNAVFTHSRDKEPGAIGGDKWASGGGNGGAGWTPLVRRRDLEE